MFWETCGYDESRWSEQFKGSIIWKINTLSFKKNIVKVFYEQKEMVHLLW